MKKPPAFGRGDAHLRNLYERMDPSRRLEVALSLGDLLIELRRSWKKLTSS
ncbi:hypothetical protein [Thermosulfurimonas sp. F29]|uniref:hypothetical protein n=1 Tax=Thermosulfurimonas sp. F29 TaxID=2867247 RepID=UPI001C83E405|nr:hypothetical protein [Thermosulfurimonas sp. F29]MBX6422322.1 hypothetical protein [Thermosulfurimonas sp. F29]